ncbi:hypothetical protein MXB_984 [Myxobolus squamalis]|nr:hypothetical protein MXB_984 [Myxobolus squamalis]
MNAIQENVTTFLTGAQNFVKKIIFEAFIKNSEKRDESIKIETFGKLTASFFMVLIAVIVNLIGVFLCTIYKKKYNKDIVMTREELMKLPLFLSFSLFGIFLFLNLISVEYITMAIKIYSLVYGFGALGRFFSIIGDYIWPEYLVPNRSFKLVLTEQETDMASYSLSAAIVIAYYLSKSWILNNIIAASFTFTLLDTLTLDKFWHSLILFGGLFIYDVFWVYGTNVMVAVASKIDAPLIIPYKILQPDAKVKYSGLGLGDVAIPGLFLSFLLSFFLHSSVLFHRDNCYCNG